MADLDSCINRRRVSACEKRVPDAKMDQSDHQSSKSDADASVDCSRGGGRNLSGTLSNLINRLTGDVVWPASAIENDARLSDLQSGMRRAQNLLSGGVDNLGDIYRQTPNCNTVARA